MLLLRPLPPSLPPPPPPQTSTMRAGAGGCTVQQALTSEAASVMKEAVSLARQRGHAQVTPLHVATTMLSSTTGFLRAACLQSHSHPLHCKALELCFNVALNRLPASSSAGPMLGSHPYHHHHHHHHHYPPSLSNALVAAFKRAQAHQRRGSMETQQQPLLAVKIELEQLIISILDDPSVSRVMREAGFSSTQVKTNVEQAVLLESPTNPSSTNLNETTSKTKPVDDQVRREDARTVIHSLVKRRQRSVVIVGECPTTAEAVVRGVMDLIENGDVPEALRNLQITTLTLHSFSLMSREEVDQKVGELRCSVVKRRGAILYLGDLKWAAEYRISCGGRTRSNGYCPVEHVVMEIRSLLRGGDGRFRVMGVATYQTYMRCKIGSPSLEAAWGLQLLALPAGTLELSLKCDSNFQSQLKKEQVGKGPSWSLLQGVENQLNCCADCSIKFEAEARGLPNISSSSHGSITSSLPSWLQQYNDKESKKEASNDNEWIQNLCNKWNSICHSSRKPHHSSEMTLHFSSTSPSSSISSYNQHHSSINVQTHHTIFHTHPDGQRYQTLPSTNPNPNPNSTSSSDTMVTEHPNRFKELNAENLKLLCNTLEREVPWQTNIIPEIASTILQCRSGMLWRKKRPRLAGPKEDTWLFFIGGDVAGKERLARELATMVFGSRASFVTIGNSSFSSTTRSGSTGELSPNKRSRLEANHGYLERFTEAILDDPHRVILMEDMEQVDSYSQMGIKNAIERGRIQGPDGEEVSISDAIVILCCESFDSKSRVCSPPINQRPVSEDEDGDDKAIGSSVCLDLNLAVGDHCCSFEDVGLVESVDRTFIFKLPEL